MMKKKTVIAAILQMLDPHVFGHGVASIGTASQRQRRRELEVVEIADSPLRRGRIHQYPAGLHAAREAFQLLGLQGVDVEGCRMAVPKIGRAHV